MKRTIQGQTINVDTEYLEFFSESTQKRVTVYLVRGYEDGNGVFHEVQRETVTISGQNYDDLVAGNAQGKQLGHFRNDDVLAIADLMRA